MVLAGPDDTVLDGIYRVVLEVREKTEMLQKRAPEYHATTPHAAVDVYSPNTPRRLGGAFRCLTFPGEELFLKLRFLFFLGGFCIMGRYWTAEDISKLRSMAGRYPAAKIAEELGRAVTAIYVKASDLRIALRRPAGAISRDQQAES